MFTARGGGKSEWMRSPQVEPAWTCFQACGWPLPYLSGRFTPGDGTKSLRRSVQGLLAEGQRRILLNMGEVAYIARAGSGELVAVLISVQNRGGELKLLKLTRKVHDAVQITKLYTVFEPSDDEGAAIKSFK